MSGPTTAWEHLRYDTEHRFIELIPGDRTQPYLGRTDLHPGDKIKLLVRNNPKKEGTKAHQAFALYRNGMTVDEFVRAYGTVAFLAAFEERPGRAGPTTAKCRALLPGIDRYSYWAKRVRDIIGAHVSDLGGIDAISEAEKSILRRAATITIECERLERRFAAYPRDHVARNDLDVYIRLSNSLRHLLDLTGLERRSPKTLVPSIDQYVADHSSDPVIDVPDRCAGRLPNEHCQR